MKKITSIEHAIEVLNQKIDFDLLRSGFIAAGVPSEDIEPNIADIKIKKIIEAHKKLNNFRVDWGNTNQYCIWKWVKSNKTKPSGFGFSRTYSDRWIAGAAVGSRLLVESHAAAMYIGTDFEELFEIAWFIIEKEQEK